MATKSSSEVEVFNQEQILTSEKALKIKQEAAELMIEEGMNRVIKDEPYAIITISGSHWFKGIVMIGYTGVVTTKIMDGKDDGGNYVAINYTTDQDKEENHSYNEVIIHEETPPIDVLGSSPRASVGFKHYYVQGRGDSGFSSEPVSFRKSFLKPTEGQLTIEEAFIISISKRINDKHMQGLSPHFGSSKLFATKISPTK
ncbi:MAG: hypothetical protein WCT22_00655 [Patescibacteria group bacterium]